MAGDPIDKHVGARVRLARSLAGLTQSSVAEALDLTFQQVQKYEKGSNRLSAAKLVRLARLLGQTPEWFFEDLPEEVQGAGVRGKEQEFASFQPDKTALRRETLELVRSYNQIDSDSIRDRFLSFVNALGQEDALAEDQVTDA